MFPSSTSVTSHTRLQQQLTKNTQKMFPTLFKNAVEKSKELKIARSWWQLKCLHARYPTQSQYSANFSGQKSRKVVIWSSWLRSCDYIIGAPQGKCPTWQVCWSWILWWWRYNGPSFLVFYVILQYHVIKGSFDFLYRSPSRWITILPRLVVIDTVEI